MLLKWCEFEWIATWFMWISSLRLSRAGRVTAQGAVFVCSIVGLRNSKVADLKRCFHSAFNYHLFLVNFVYPACLPRTHSFEGKKMNRRGIRKSSGNDDKYSCPFYTSHLFLIFAYRSLLRRLELDTSRLCLLFSRNFVIYFHAEDKIRIFHLY